MELLFDTANLSAIDHYLKILPAAGVTTNPTIITAEGKVDVFAHLSKIKALLTPGQKLHVQVTADTVEGMLEDAAVILEQLGQDTCIKVPVSETGLPVIRVLKSRGVTVTATTIYTKMQGMLALMAGADYLAVYCNRIDDMDGDSAETVAALREVIERENSAAQIVGASFRNINQIQRVLLAGAHSVTVKPEIVAGALTAPFVTESVSRFTKDWEAVFGQEYLYQMSQRGE